MLRHLQSFIVIVSLLLLVGTGIATAALHDSAAPPAAPEASRAAADVVFDTAHNLRTP